MLVHLRIRTATVLAALAFVLLAPFPGAAAKNPQGDPTCWQEDQCEKAGGSFERNSACGGEWGRCYPKEPIPIQITLPGLDAKEVRDLGQYIQLAYAWGVRVAAIFAVIAIMVGGLMWLTSAGADRLGKAKEIIGNAVIGLLIAMFSYVILKTINPDLVRLSLPRTMMLRSIIAATEICSKVDLQFQIFPLNEQTTPVDTDRKKLPCGETFQTPGAPKLFCSGDYCDPGQGCKQAEGTNRYECAKVYGTDIFAQCADGTESFVGSSAALLGAGVAVLAPHAEAAALSCGGEDRFRYQFQHRFTPLPPQSATGGVPPTGVGPPPAER